MGAFMTILGLGGAGLGAYGQYTGGKQQQQIAKYNAGIKDREARLTEEASKIEQGRMAEEARKLKATQRAKFSTSGAEISEGTPLMVMAEQAGIMERDALNQLRNRSIQATTLRSEADMLRASGDAAKRAGEIGAGATLLSGVGMAGMSLLG